MPLALLIPAGEAPAPNPEAYCVFVHFLKLCLSLCAVGLELAMLLWNVLKESDVDLAQVITNFLGACMWLYALFSVRVQFLREQRTRKHLRMWWVVVLCAQIVAVPLELIFSVGHRVLEDDSVEEVLLLVVELVLMLLGCCYSSDIAMDEWSVHSNSILNSFLSSRNSRKLSEEEVWKSLTPLSSDTDSQSTTLHSVSVLSRQQDPSEKVDSTQFRIEVHRGQGGRYITETYRTYDEFAALVGSVADSSMPRLPKPAHGPLSSKQLDHRRKEFDHLLQVLVRACAGNENLSDFLKPASEVPVFHCIASSRQSFMSIRHTAIQDLSRPASSEMKEIPRGIGEVEVTITGTYDTRSRLKKFTMYQIETVVLATGERVACEHRFSDFKELVRRLSKDYEIRTPLPKGGVRKASTDPKVVQERRTTLQSLLQEVVCLPSALREKALLEFLKLSDVMRSE